MGTQSTFDQVIPFKGGAAARRHDHDELRPPASGVWWSWIEARGTFEHRCSSCGGPIPAGVLYQWRQKGTRPNGSTVARRCIDCAIAAAPAAQGAR